MNLPQKMRHWSCYPPGGRFPEESLSAASLPRLFYLQDHSCTPACTADLNSSFTKSEFLLPAGNPSWWEGQGPLVVYPNSRLWLSSHTSTFLCSPISVFHDRLHVGAFFTSFPSWTQLGNTICFVYLAVPHHSHRPCQPAFSFGLI